MLHTLKAWGQVPWPKTVQSRDDASSLVYVIQARAGDKKSPGVDGRGSNYMEQYMLREIWEKQLLDQYLQPLFAWLEHSMDHMPAEGQLRMQNPTTLNLWKYWSQPVWHPGVLQYQLDFFYHGSQGCCWCLLNWRRRCCITSMIQLQEVILECSKQLHGCVRTVIGMAWFRMCRFALILLLSAGRTCGLGWIPVHLYSVSRLVTQERGCIWIFSAQSWRTTMANSMYWRW